MTTMRSPQQLQLGCAATRRLVAISPGLAAISTSKSASVTATGSAAGITASPADPVTRHDLTGKREDQTGVKHCRSGRRFFRVAAPESEPKTNPDQDLRREVRGGNGP